jgi:hypothetical protein
MFSRLRSLTFHGVTELHFLYAFAADAVGELGRSVLRNVAFNSKGTNSLNACPQAEMICFRIA